MSLRAPAELSKIRQMCKGIYRIARKGLVILRENKTKFKFRSRKQPQRKYRFKKLFRRKYKISREIFPLG
jgi:hypothetical protein